MPTKGENPRPLIIGLVGSVGAGKSTVAAMLAERGCVVVDSDLAVRDVLLTDAARDELVRWWGTEVLGADGRIDRAAVARIVFSSEAQRRRLEQFIHPLLKPGRDRAIARAAQDGAPAVVLDAPLLYEAGLDRECDVVIVVDADGGARLARVRAARGWTPEELARREKSQLPLEDKARRADYLVDNSGDRAALAESVARVFSKIMEQRARQDPASDRGPAKT
jgi:dephospho-CoA kinase